MLEGKDILGLAQTGTGKTAAFVLPMLQRLSTGPRNIIRALIMAPTRELAQQIHNNICILGKNTDLRSAVVYGGVGRQPQLTALRRGTEIIVACPGRLLDLLGEKGVSLSSVELLVLDEADHMFDKGFLPDMRKIIKRVPIRRQSVIFSATMPSEIDGLTQEVLTNPVRITIDHIKAAPNIKHTLFPIGKSEKTQLLQSLLREKEMTRTLVFTRTKHKAKSLAVSLQKMGFKAVSMQGNLSQQKRLLALEGFKRSEYTVLVATDIAARGIDVSQISHVINFDLPDTIETYTHRTGRTGRAQNSGKAYSFVTNEDKRFTAAIKQKYSVSINAVHQIASNPVEKNETSSPRKKGSPSNTTPQPQAHRQSSRKKSRASAFDFGLRQHAANHI